MVTDLIPENTSREYHAGYALTTQAMAIDDSPMQVAAMLYALVICSQT